MILEPTLLLNTEICKANINNMANRIKQWGGNFRPHFKTHQSAKIAEWYREIGIDSITVSSFKMAEYFATNGWKDITVAITCTAMHVNTINQLASKINLNIIVEDLQSIITLEKKLKQPVGLFIKIDAGYHRTGIDADNFTLIKSLLKNLKDCKNLIFVGFLTHAGNTYSARDKDEIIKIATPSLQKTLALKAFLKNDFPLMQLSWGDTPSCAIYNEFYGIDEFRPGNMVFFDYMQSIIGSCTTKDIAICMAVPVIAVHPERGEVIVHGGAVHLSKDHIKLTNGNISYGKAVALEGLNWDANKQLGEVKSLSQEHGVIAVEKEWMDTIKPGDTLGILPIHACLTANLMKQYLTTEGNFIETMK